MSARRSSSAPTPRPRKIAGRDRTTRPELEPSAEPAPAEAEAEDTGPVTGARAPSSTSEEVEVEEAADVEPPAEVQEVAKHPSRDRSGEEPELDSEREGDTFAFATSPTTTRVLLVVLAVLAAAALAGGGYLWWQGRDDGGDGGGPAATDERPVRVTVSDAQGAASAAAEAAETIISASWQNYDDEVAEAQKLMTPEFAEKQYLPTARDSENDVVRSKTEVQVQVKGVGIHRADTDHVEALVFLDQLVTKDGKDPLLSPYRVLISLDRTDSGWLVSDLDSK